MFWDIYHKERISLTKKCFQNKNWKRKHVFKPLEWLRLKSRFQKSFFAPEQIWGFRLFGQKALFFSYLFLGLEDVTAEDVALSVSGDVTENLQILGVMRHVEYPERRNEMGQQNRTWIQGLAAFPEWLFRGTSGTRPVSLEVWQDWNNVFFVCLF